MCELRCLKGKIKPAQSLSLHDMMRFDPKLDQAFARALTQRVNAYFKENDISPGANKNYYIKAGVMAAVYWVPFLFILFLGPNANWLFYLLWSVMGIGMSGIGMNVMHDANHGSVSKKGWVNQFFANSMVLLSGYSLTWKIQHNHLHHTYTNVHGLDDDIETEGLLRLHPNDKWKKLHKYQHIYGLFVYGLLTLNWAAMKDFKQLQRYNKEGLLEKHNSQLGMEIWKLIGVKILYFMVFIGLPLFAGYSILSTLLGFVLMHFIAGVVLSVIFQLAHILPETTHPDMETGKERGWHVHQLLTTANFSMDSPFMTFFTGGLNFQVEHHLFPHICHVHYPALSSIVKQTAQEFEVPYNSHPSFMKAVSAHMTFLKEMGKPEVQVA